MSLDLFAESFDGRVEDLSPNEVLTLRTLCYLATDERFVYETNTDIGRHTSYREPTTVSRLLGRLERKGYIQRHGSSTDRVIYIMPSEYWPQKVA